jgi:hypothetical protein
MCMRRAPSRQRRGGMNQGMGGGQAREHGPQLRFKGIRPELRHAGVRAGGLIGLALRLRQFARASASSLVREIRFGDPGNEP